MYKLSVPISLNGINEESIPQYLADFKACGVDRVFIAGLGYIHDSNGNINTRADLLQSSINIFRENGYEIGVWASAFGHGVALSYMKTGTDGSCYTEIEGDKVYLSDISPYGFAAFEVK